MEKRYINVVPIIDKINENYNEEYNEWGMEINDLVEMIEDAPTADVREVRRGKWVFKNEGTYNRLRAYCSVCGLHSGIGGIRKNQLKPFCPNCGAVMEVE